MQNELVLILDEAHRHAQLHRHPRPCLCESSACAARKLKTPSPHVESFHRPATDARPDPAAATHVPDNIQFSAPTAVPIRRIVSAQSPSFAHALPSTGNAEDNSSPCVSAATAANLAPD